MDAIFLVNKDIILYMNTLSCRKLLFCIKSIWGALRNLVPFLQYKKTWKTFMEEGVLLLQKLQASAWYQIVQTIIFC